MTVPPAPRDDLMAVADLVEVTGPDSLVVGGRTLHIRGRTPARTASSPRGDDAPEETVTPSTSAESLFGDLIYRYCYVRPSAGRRASDLHIEQEFEAALSRANSSTGTWQGGWLLEASTHESGEGAGRVTVVRDGVRFQVDTDRVRSDVAGTAGTAAVPGAAPDRICTVRIPKEYRNLIPGYYLAVGDRPWDGPGGEPGGTTAAGTHAEFPVMVRLYWHVRSDGAPALTAALTDRLNHADVAFRLKLLANPAAYRRADAAVLYLPRAHYDRARDALARAHSEIRDRLREPVPLFTRRLATGLAVAEDPGNGLSFGEHRCRVVACGLLDVYESRRSDPGARRAAVVTAFHDADLDPDAPHLSSAGSVDDYSIDINSNDDDVGGGAKLPLRRAKRGGMAGSPGSAVDDGPLTAAAAIGRRLCAEAHWSSDGRRCNWLGRTSPEHLAGGGSLLPRSATLGPDVYAGLSGIALYLAELHAHTGEDLFQRTATGAMHGVVQQLRSAHPPRGPVDIGFYTGVPGAVFAVRQVATLLDEHVDHQVLQDLLTEALTSPRDDRPDDLMSGRAGAILSLIALAGHPGWEHCLDRAVVLGDELVPVTAGWLGTEDGPPPPEPVLAGLSHGASGIGTALLELHAASGQVEFLHAGRAAYTYEDSLFDTTEGNWPDLRDGPADANPDPAPRFMTAWCHGAPGGALARLRAVGADPGGVDHYRHHIGAALATTRNELRRDLLAERDPTPCHGTSGLIEALWTGGLILDVHSWATDALDAATELIREDRSRAPSGTACGGPNPSLMVGDAGLGYQLLRLHDPTGVPSLLVGPWHTAGPEPRRTGRSSVPTTAVPNLSTRSTVADISRVAGDT